MGGGSGGCDYMSAFLVTCLPDTLLVHFSCTVYNPLLLTPLLSLELIVELRVLLGVKASYAAVERTRCKCQTGSKVAGSGHVTAYPHCP